jgi:ribosomal protein L11 methyltransferase
MLSCALGRIRHTIHGVAPGKVKDFVSPLWVGLGGFSRHACVYGRDKLRGVVNTSRDVHLDGTSFKDGGRGALAEEVCCVQSLIRSVPGWIAEEFSDLLLTRGAMSATIEEHRPEGSPEQPIYASPKIIGKNEYDRWDQGTPNNRIWDQCTVVAYFPTVGHDDDIKSLINETMKEMFDSYDIVHQAEVDVLSVLGKDWESLIRESYQPVEIATGFWIVPLWANESSKDFETKVPKSARKVILEPGLAFGTGDHPTTKLCMRWLAELELELGGLQGLRVMDYGTGSGILAVASLVLGADEAVGVDVEPLAVRAAQQNAHHNGMAASFTGLLCHPSIDGPDPLAEVKSEKRRFDM